MRIHSLLFRRMAVFTAAAVLSGLCSCGKDNTPPSPPPTPDPEPGSSAIVLANPVENKVFFEKGKTADNYYIGLYSGKIEVYTTAEGSIWIPSDADSRLLYLDLYAEPGSASDPIRIPDGTYTIADNLNPGTAYSKYTYGLQYFGKDVDYTDVLSGSVTVKYTDDKCLITAKLEMVRSSDKTSLGMMEFTYQGKLEFADHSKPEPEDAFPPLKEPINTTFTGADIHYLGIPAYSSPIDVYVIDLFDDPTPLPNGALDEGNALRLELYTEHQGYFPGEKRLKMPAGTYTMTDGHVPVAVGVGTGDIWDSGYGFFPYGSFARHLDDKSEKVFYGFVNKGTVTVTTDGDKTYTIKADLTTRQGVSVKGTYTGAVEIVNEAQEPERQTQSHIYENKVLDLSKTTTADVTFSGTSKNDMTHFYKILAKDPVSRQGFQLELLAPVGEVGRIAGTYKPSAVLIPLKMVPFTYIPGDIQLVSGGAAMVGTWGFYETNAAGKYVAFAPAMTGDIVVTESDAADVNRRYIIEYVLTDDNLEEPHTMTAKFSGTFDLKNTSQAPALAAPGIKQSAAVQRPDARRIGTSRYQKQERY